MSEPLPPKKMSGCLIAFLVFCGFGIVGLAAIGFGVYRFSQSEDGKQFFAAIGEAKDLFEKATNAPGANEARGQGCLQAMIFDLKDAERLGQKFGAEQKDQKPRKDGQPQLVLVCSLARNATAKPTCEGLARSYRAAPNAAKQAIFVVVQEQGESAPLCQEAYDPSGARLPDPEMD